MSSAQASDFELRDLEIRKGVLMDLRREKEGRSRKGRGRGGEGSGEGSRRRAREECWESPDERLATGRSQL